MTKQREKPTTHVSGLAKLIAGDNSCIFSLWFKSWHHSYQQARMDRTGLAEWNARHAHVVRESADRLEQNGSNVFLETQNWFEVRSSRSGSPIIGKPDIIAQDHDGNITVYDVKTGQPRSSDEIQVKLYMLLLPRSNHGRWKGKTMNGCVLYGDGTEVAISAGAIDDEFQEHVAALMRRIVADEPPRKVPSERECAWCVVSSNDCPERVD